MCAEKASSSEKHCSSVGIRTRMFIMYNSDGKMNVFFVEFEVHCSNLFIRLFSNIVCDLFVMPRNLNLPKTKNM